MKEKNTAISVLKRMNENLNKLNDAETSEEESFEIKENLLLDAEELVSSIDKMEEIVEEINQEKEKVEEKKEKYKEETIKVEKTDSLKNLKILVGVIFLILLSVLGITIYKNVPKLSGGEDTEEIVVANPDNFRIAENNTEDEDNAFEKIKDIKETTIDEVITSKTTEPEQEKKNEELNLEKNISKAKVSNVDEARVEKDHEELDRAIAELEDRSAINEVSGRRNAVDGISFIRKDKKNEENKKETLRSRYGKVDELNEREREIEKINDRKNKIASSFNDYIVQQGAVIPAIFLTEVNTDLPGSVLAQVRENIYDSRTGNHLLIPKGSKLYGRYESNVIKGQTRVFMAWDKLSLPNGKYIELSEFHAGDNLGSSGVSDKTNNHTWSLIGNAILSSVLNFADTLASGVSFNIGGLKIGLNGQYKESKDTSPFKDVTSNLVKKEVERQPTITIRRGYKFNIIVNGDMELEKYKY
ncbi:TrbI/VirB10 family protein [Streptobacillus moniliformis]|uniref:TrbI/VirB10 family protein n=1 Tax=Streptobacillus moniliformis TaxID=34105 RepID=UPI0007E388A1|nr:TrbI/VirB10 family protein [Streptobacillus moniliformis]